MDIFIRQNTSNPAYYQRIAAYGITTTTLLIFLAIVTHHVYCWLNMKQAMKKITKRFKPQPVQTDNNQHPLSGSLDNSTVIAVPAPAVTYVDMQELREPLLSEGGQES